MQCSDARKKLNAWVDNELSAHEGERITTHLDRCPACRTEAASIRQIAASLEALPPYYAPTSLSKNVLRVFRADFEKPGMAEWWQSLTLSMRSAFCGAALAGLLVGAVLGTSVVSTVSVTQSDPYQILYASEGIVP